MTELPQVNSLLFISVNEDDNWRSRVEDIDGETLTVAAPLGAGDLEVPEDGVELEVFWIGTRARYVMPVRMMGLTRDRPARWYLRATGEPTRQTRRNFVRGGGGGAAEITPSNGTSGGPHVGTVIDISEGGVRCRLGSVNLAQGEPVKVRVQLGDARLEISGNILLTREQDDGTDVVVVYQLSESDAQTVRRYVFQWEIAERRRQLDSEPSMY